MQLEHLIYFTWDLTGVAEHAASVREAVSTAQ